MAYKLQLDNITFSGFELPEELPLGGEQKLAVRQFPGGHKSVQVMGDFDDPIEWSGELWGQGALEKALALDEMRRAGKPLLLSWGPVARRVIVASFKFRPMNEYRVPYTIRLEVLPAQYSAGPADSLAAAAAPAASGASPSPVPSPRTYVVQPGDSLSKIAARLYGDASRWRDIYRANAGKIKNPNLIYPGQKLVIP
ncbi:MAG: LysM peptidoglycan-binding domain-containing protein [Thermoanaerobacter sp.]|nr:LysM peptidoglycan-binding domain-containing protein [Thermoanaerobacter sp.]